MFSTRWILLPVAIRRYPWIQTSDGEFVCHWSKFRMYEVPSFDPALLFISPAVTVSLCCSKYQCKNYFTACHNRIIVGLGIASICMAFRGHPFLPRNWNINSFRGALLLCSLLTSLLCGHICSWGSLGVIELSSWVNDFLLLVTTCKC